MGDEAFRKVADDALGLAVSVFTLASEKDRSDNGMLARSLYADVDPVVAGQALLFACRLLSRYMTPEQMVAEKEALIRRVLGA